MGPNWIATNSYRPPPHLELRHLGPHGFEAVNAGV
jgi:hypothetical protein